MIRMSFYAMQSFKQLYLWWLNIKNIYLILDFISLNLDMWSYSRASVFITTQSIFLDNNNYVYDNKYWPSSFFL